MEEYNFIKNPITGKKVNIYSKNGKKIIQKYVEHMQSGGFERPLTCFDNFVPIDVKLPNDKTGKEVAIKARLSSDSLRVLQTHHIKELGTTFSIENEPPLRKDGLPTFRYNTFDRKNAITGRVLPRNLNLCEKKGKNDLNFRNMGYPQRIFVGPDSKSIITSDSFTRTIFEPRGSDTYSKYIPIMSDIKLGPLKARVIVFNTDNLEWNNVANILGNTVQRWKYSVNPYNYKLGVERTPWKNIPTKHRKDIEKNIKQVLIVCLQGVKNPMKFGDTFFSEYKCTSDAKKKYAGDASDGCWYNKVKTKGGSGSTGRNIYVFYPEIPQWVVKVDTKEDNISHGITGGAGTTVLKVDMTIQSGPVTKCVLDGKNADEGTCSNSMISNTDNYSFTVMNSKFPEKCSEWNGAIKKVVDKFPKYDKNKDVPFIWCGDFSSRQVPDSLIETAQATPFKDFTKALDKELKEIESSKTLLQRL